MEKTERLEMQLHAQHDADEAFKAAVEGLEYLGMLNPVVEAMLPTMWQFMKEYLHWLYSKPGEHQTVAEMLKEVIAEQRGMMSDDKKPEIAKITTMEKDNKTND